MHSVENRFVAIVCGAMLVFVAPLIVLYLTLSSERVGRERLQNAQILMDAGAQALGKPLWDFDADAVGQIAKSLIANTDIVSVYVHDSSSSISVQVPHGQTDIHLPHTRLVQDCLLYTSPSPRD